MSRSEDLYKQIFLKIQSREQIFFFATMDQLTNYKYKIEFLYHGSILAKSILMSIMNHFKRILFNAVLSF